ncbi:hypothetical protein ACFXK0_07595 [Nocardia sp. NPDC059177]|uniref:hypothetical protein n=1 Tax=Nocardia sp. NPDC059177 TaxID=3346759 RepID=UPI0036B5815D
MADNVDRWWEAPGFSGQPPEQQPDANPPGQPTPPPGDQGANSTMLYGAGQGPQPTPPPAGSGQFAQPAFPPPGDQGANSTMVYGAGQAPQPTPPPGGSGQFAQPAIPQPPAGSGQFAQPAIPPPPGDQGANSTMLYGAGQEPQPTPPPAGSGQFAQPTFPPQAGSGQFAQPAIPQPPGDQGANSTVLYGAGQAPQPVAPPAGSGQYSQPSIPQGYADPNAAGPYGNPQAGYPAPGGYGQQAGQFPPQQYGAPQAGYGQQPPYGQQPYGYAPQQPPGPRKGGAGVIFAVLGVVVALAITVTVAVLIGTGGDDDETTVAASTTVNTTAPLSGTTTAPVSPGAKGVLIPAYRVAYDVPSNWSVEAAYDTMGITGLSGTITGRGKATEGEDYCPGSAYRGLVGVTAITESDLGAAATTVAKIAAEGGYSDPTGGTLTAPTALTTDSGLTGQFVEGSGPWTPSVPGCTADAYSVYSFAFRNAAGTMLALALLVDRNATGELPAEQAREMISTLRLV